MEHVKLIGVAIFAIVLLGATARAAEPDAIVGTWLAEEKDGKIKIYKCGAKYCGKVIWIKPTKEQPKPEEMLDVHNPNPKKRGQKVLGKTILWGLTHDAEDKRWEEGFIYDNRRGKVYGCQVSLKGPNKLLLRGFVGISLIGKTTSWTRIN
jgi:uncharacterized protein (DUF2147 family)